MSFDSFQISIYIVDQALPVAREKEIGLIAKRLEDRAPNREFLIPDILGSIADFGDNSTSPAVWD